MDLHNLEKCQNSHYTGSFLTAFSHLVVAQTYTELENTYFLTLRKPTSVFLVDIYDDK